MSRKKEDQFANKIKRLIPDENHRLNMIMTLLGTSGMLTEFVMTCGDVSKLPIDVKYACALTSANMIAFISDGKRGIFKDMDEPYEMGEQTQERIYRKMKWIIEELYKFIQENEKEV